MFMNGKHMHIQIRYIDIQIYRYTHTHICYSSLFFAISCMNTKCHTLYHIIFVKLVSHISQIKYHNLTIIRNPKETGHVCLHVSNVSLFLKITIQIFHFRDTWTSTNPNKSVAFLCTNNTRNIIDLCPETYIPTYIWNFGI